MKNQMYKMMAYFFYIIGDILCRIPTDMSYFLYQKSMNISVHLDEKTGFNIWKQPTE